MYYSTYWSNWCLSVPPSSVVIMLSWTFHILIFSCKTTLPNGTKLDWDLGRGDSDWYVSRNRNGNVIAFCMKYSISWEIKIKCCINYENTRVYQVRSLSVQELIYQLVILGNRLSNHFHRKCYVNADVWFESSFWYTDSSLDNWRPLVSVESESKG